MSKKYLISFLALATVFAVACAPVFAEDNNQNNEDATSVRPVMAKMMGDGFQSDDFRMIGMKLPVGLGQKGLVVTPSDEVMIGGAKVVSVNSSTYNLNVLGLTVSVATNSDTKFSGTASTTGVAVGDMVSVKGTIDETTGVITAKQVRDESQVSSAVSDLQAKIKALQDQIRQLLEQAKNLRTQ